MEKWKNKLFFPQLFFQKTEFSKDQIKKAEISKDRKLIKPRKWPKNHTTFTQVHPHQFFDHFLPH